MAKRENRKDDLEKLEKHLKVSNKPSALVSALPRLRALGPDTSPASHLSTLAFSFLADFPAGKEQNRKRLWCVCVCAMSAYVCMSLNLYLDLDVDLGLDLDPYLEREEGFRRRQPQAGLEAVRISQPRPCRYRTFMTAPQAPPVPAATL